MVTVCWYPAGLVHYRFLNSGKTITSEKYAHQAKEMHENRTTCSRHWSAERAGFSGTAPPGARGTAALTGCTCRKVRLGRRVHLDSCQPTATSSSILTAVCRENASTTSRRQKIISKSSSNPEAWIFMIPE